MSAFSSEPHWPHAPLHRLSEAGTFIVTAGTYAKAHLFVTEASLDMLQETLLRVLRQADWQLEAWAVFSNHYHFVAHSPSHHSDAMSLQQLINRVHSETARRLNESDQCEGRRVWHNYWETRLTFERSYLARLNYVHQNPVRHNLVTHARDYRWCSAKWFEQTATRAQVQTIYSFKTDGVKVQDDFEVVA